MTIELQPLHPTIGARLTGIDARRPLTAAEVEAIEAGMDRHAVLVLPGQDITDASSSPSPRNFGPLEEGANSARARRGAAASAPSSPTSPTSARTARGSRATTGAAWRRSPTGCGIPTPRSAPCPPGTPS